MVIAIISRGFVTSEDGSRGYVYIVTVNGKAVERDFRNRSDARKAANARVRIYPNNRVRENWPDGMSWRATKKGWPVDLKLTKEDGLYG
jgi:hypothetical protein